MWELQGERCQDKHMMKGQVVGVSSVLAFSTVPSLFFSSCDVCDRGLASLVLGDWAAWIGVVVDNDEMI